MLLSHVCLLATPRSAAHQATLPLIVSRSLPKFMFIASVMQSSHRSIRDFTKDATSDDADSAMSHAMQGCPRWTGHSREL